MMVHFRIQLLYSVVFSQLNDVIECFMCYICNAIPHLVHWSNLRLRFRLCTVTAAPITVIWLNWHERQGSRVTVMKFSPFPSIA